MPSNITVRIPSLEELDAYAIRQWEVYFLSLTLNSWNLGFRALIFMTHETVMSQHAWFPTLQYILALFLMTYKFGKTVFLAAPYKLG